MMARDPVRPLRDPNMIHNATLCLERPANRRPSVGVPFVGMLAWLRDRHAVYRQRREPLALDDRC